jgi:hypothetical protein
MRVRIRQLDERVATQGLHFGRGPSARKIEPGEVVDIPEGELFEILWATGKLELTRDPVTRPIEFANEREARLCSPTFTPRGPDEEVEQQRALDTVSARIAETEVASEAETANDSPATETPHVAEREPPEVPEATAHNRRAARRAAANRVQENTT